jgi:hypothetical protein
MGYDRM